jgi:hypothetical protein
MVYGRSSKVITRDICAPIDIKDLHLFGLNRNENKTSF